MIILILVIAIVASITFLVHRNKGGNVSNVKRIVIASEVYSEQDINNGMDIVIKYFQRNFEVCTLMDL